MEAKITDRTISFGNQRYRVDNNGNWTVLAFGTSISNHSMHWNWINIPKDRVPNEVIKKATT